MAEDRIQHHLLSRNQFIHIRLGVVIKHCAALRVTHAALRRFDVGLLLGDEERCQAMAQVMEPEPLALFEHHPRLDCGRAKIIDAQHVAYTGRSPMGLL